MFIFLLNKEMQLEKELPQTVSEFKGKHIN